MKLVKVNNVPRKRGYSKNVALIDEFLNSDIRNAEVVFGPDEYSNVYSCSGALRKTAQRMHCNSIEIFAREGHVYMVKK